MKGRKCAAAICLLLALLLPARAVTACSWDYSIWIPRDKAADPLYRFVEKGKAGYIDRAGKVVIKPTFDAYGNSGGEFHDGLLATGVADGPYVDATGKVVIDKGYYRNWEFSDGLAAAMRNDGEKWGYIDRTGEFAIPPRFEGYPRGYVYPFSEGLAMIGVGKKYGYIDHSGELVIGPGFLFGAEFHDGMARVVVEGPCSYFSFTPCPDSRTLGETDGSPLPACKFTFIDRSGKVVPGEGYDEAKDFSEGLAAVRIGEKWGYVDGGGRLVIRPQFERAGQFSEGLARVRQGELWGYINRQGEFAIGLQFKVADDFSDGLAAVGRWDGGGDVEKSEFYYIDRRGVQAVAEKFTLASHFFKGLAHVRLKAKGKKKGGGDSDRTGTFAYIDTAGRKVFTYVNSQED